VQNHTCLHNILARLDIPERSWPRTIANLAPLILLQGSKQEDIYSWHHHKERNPQCQNRLTTRTNLIKMRQIQAHLQITISCSQKLHRVYKKAKDSRKSTFGPASTGDGGETATGTLFHGEKRGRKEQRRGEGIVLAARNGEKDGDLG
jgi:hypothetical protein